MKTRKLVSTVVVFGIILGACSPTNPFSPSNPSGKTVAVTGVSLSESEMTVLLNEDKTLVATVTPSDATDKTVQWSSSDDKVATVTDGKVKGVAEGRAVITAKAGGKTATCNVTVRKPGVVETGDVVGISFSTARITLQVFFQYAEPGTTFENAGIIYGKSRDLEPETSFFAEIEKDKEGNPDTSGSYTVSPIALEEGTTYYYKATALFSGVYYYGEVKSFQTTTLNIATDQLVDMGLSVKWAGWNVGASKPEEFGEYYVWGSAEPASKVTKKWLNSDGTATKYGAVDGKTVLDLEDDAAAANWEGKWRMPTEEEKRELESNTYQTKYTLNGVPGYVFTSEVNGASIFIPAAGYSYYGDVLKAGDFTTFWTSTLCPTDERGAAIACDKVLEGGKPVDQISMLYELGFYWEVATSQRQMAYRWWGCPVRAVWDEDRPEVIFTPEIDTVIGYDLEETSSTVKLYGRIKNFFRNGRTAADLPEFGFCYIKGLGISPTVNDNKVTCDASDGAQDGFDFAFSKVITGLDSETDYGFAAYAVFDGTPSYDPGYKFRTKIDMSALGLDPTLQAVDLGLPSGLKWAGWNIGASKPGEMGDTYRWGEAEPVQTGDYKWWDPAQKKYTKYVLPGEEKYGVSVDNLTVLEPSDDPATVTWGSDWRTPTDAEWKELIDNCTQTYYYDLLAEYGLLLTGPNGKSIYFATGSGVNITFWPGNRRDDPATDYWDISCPSAITLSRYSSPTVETTRYSRNYDEYIRAVTDK